MRSTFGNTADEEIRGAVITALTHDARLSSAQTMHVGVEGGQVTLSGVVRSAREKTAATEDVTRVPGVAGVDNVLTVATDGTVPDDVLRDKVVAVLDVTPGVSLRDVGVIVEDGLVTLVGHVRELNEATAAMDAAESVKGIQNVVSQLSVAETVPVDGTPTDDVTLANLAIDALADADLDVDSLSTRSVEGTVYLTGFAYSAADLDRATDVVQQVPGVAGVENGIVLRGDADSKDPDEALAARVMHALTEDGRASPGRLTVSVHKGVVHLGGQVDSINQQNAAYEVARSVPGVRRVNGAVLLTDRTSEPSGDKGHPRADIQAWLAEKKARR